MWKTGKKFIVLFTVLLLSAGFSYVYLGKSNTNINTSKTSNNNSKTNIKASALPNGELRIKMSDIQDYMDKRKIR